MTIRRQWLIILTLTAVIAVFVNTVVLGSLINRYFLSYNADIYDSHVNQIEILAKDALKDQSYSYSQLAVQLRSHLDDPILRIELYDENGVEIASAQQDYENMRSMMGHMMNSFAEETDVINLTENGAVIGQLVITRYSSLNNSIVSRLFKGALLRNSGFSFVVVLLVLVVIGMFISRKMSRDLTDTAAQAIDIDLGNQENRKLSKVKEIRIIQQSLVTLGSKLKLKQIARKRLVDELVHQTRTPLTILKTHLEGFEDGIITMSPEEIKICEEQIDNISAIIANMSGLIDADRTNDEVKTEEFEFSGLLKQIIRGLKVQFDNKKIDLILSDSQKITVTTDRYKLSQCIYNILINAYKFTQQGGKVEIFYSADRSNLTVTVRDTGIGIPDKDIEHLFDAYYRGDGATGIAGEGLGLYIVKENLDKIGGTISVSSQIGKGSSFILSIPLDGSGKLT